MSHGRLGLWLRWSWRDLRQRWAQVLAIAVIIAIGSGVYTGLSSNTVWRSTSYDASYDALAVHDILVTTADGTYAEEGVLAAAARSIPHAEWLDDIEERVVVTTQVDARAVSDDALLVPGRIVGVDVAGGGPHIDRFELDTGRTLAEADAGRPLVFLDSHFRSFHGLPDTGSLRTSGGEVEYVGTGYTPEYFVVASGQGSFLAEAGFAVVFSSVETAQQLGGVEGMVNQAVLRVTDGADAEQVVAELETVLSGGVLATEVVWIEEDPLYRRLYDDIESDQKLFNIFAGLILGGAAFAAFNLTGRIVEAQRREIGIGMALGLDRYRIAVRPMLVGLQIGALGVVVGALFGVWVGALISDLNTAFVPLPVWRDDFQPQILLRGSGIALVLVAVATAYPVWRAVRVDPVDAIRTRTVQGRAGRLTTLLHRIPLPGSSITQFPVRNLVRAPRRTLLTAFGVASAIAVLVALTGMIDSFLTTIDQGEQEILGDRPERTTVTLDFFYPVDAPEVQAVVGSASVGLAEPQLVVGGALLPDDGDEFEALITLIDFSSELWTPTPVSGGLTTGGPSVVIAAKAAEDLGARPGDTVTLRHPRRRGLGYEFVESPVRVAAIHPNPYRFMVYLDEGSASMLGLEGIVNTVSVTPVDGASVDDLKEALFGQPGVAAVEGVNEVASLISDSLEDFLGFLAVIQGFVLMMALLIAFNSTSISSDERRREHATMFAFGLPTGRVMRLTIAETFLVGVLGTGLGIVVGRVLLGGMVRVLLPDTIPDLGITVDVAGATYATAALLGIAAVSVAPLLTLRRLRRMDVPATLRVVE